MPRAFRTLDDIGDIAGKRVLVREDLNVPMADGAVTDDTRLRAAVPTVAELADKGAKVVVLAHFGRPKGQRNPEMSLALVTKPFEQVLGRPVRFRRGEERSGDGRAARGARRSLCQRRVFRRAPGARLYRGAGARASFVR